jgi:uncharacterized MAPEG superfamily protein
MTSLFWLPYIINRMLEQGIVNAVWDPFGDTHTGKPWANRMMQAHNNAIENLIIFAPLVILIQITGMNSSTTATACMVYFFTRLTHYFVFTLAVPLLRVATFLIGFGVQVILTLTLLGF